MTRAATCHETVSLKIKNSDTLYLIQQDLLQLPILYLSGYIIANKDDYYKLLLGVTRYQAWEPWILFMLKAVEEKKSFSFTQN